MMDSVHLIPERDRVIFQRRGGWDTATTLNVNSIIDPLYSLLFQMCRVTLLFLLNNNAIILMGLYFDEQQFLKYRISTNLSNISKYRHYCNQKLFGMAVQVAH